MEGYITKSEAQKITGRSINYLNRYIESGEIATISSPTCENRKFLSVSDIYKVLSDKEQKRIDKEQEEQAKEKKKADERRKRREIKHNQQFQQVLPVMVVRLEMLDRLSFHGISVQELYPYDAEIRALADMPENERKQGYDDLCNKIISQNKNKRRAERWKK